MQVTLGPIDARSSGDAHRDTGNLYMGVVTTAFGAAMLALSLQPRGTK
jgi:hypothetical protein